MSADLGASMGFAEFLQASFYSEHDAVDVASMKDRLGQLTNFGLHMLFWDATAETAAEDLGRDWEVESERMDEEAAEEAERNPATSLLDAYEKRPGELASLQKQGLGQRDETS